MIGTQTKWFVHRLHCAQAYGGPEEGGWWFDLETPIDPRAYDYTPPFEVSTEEAAFHVARKGNAAEQERRKSDNQYGYTSVLSYRDTFYVYDVQDSDIPHQNPTHWPHYE